MKTRFVQFSITIGALSIGLVHLIWPSLKIDAVTIILFFIALVPWLAPFLKSIELPGGLKFELNKFERVSNKADEVGLLTELKYAEPERRYSFQHVAKEDPKLALAGLRIEIEKRLVEIAESSGIQTNKAGVNRLLRVLGERERLTHQQRSVLADMVGLLNAAVHGGDIDDRAAEWALDVGPRLLNTLEAKAKNNI